MNTCSWIMDDETQCGEMCEGFTNFCGSHNRMMRRQQDEVRKQAEKRAQMIDQQKAKNSIPRKKPNKVSDKRAEINEEYFKLVEQFKKDNPECKANVNNYCTKTTEDVHHKRGRNSFLLDSSTFLPVCRSCHDYIEAHPKEAKEKGWSMSRLEKQTPTI